MARPHASAVLADPHAVAARRARRARQRLAVGLAAGVLAIAGGTVALVLAASGRSIAARYDRLATAAAEAEGAEAARLWRRAVGLAPGIAAPRVRLARALLAVGDEAEAARALGEALARDPEHLEAALLAAELAIRRGAAAEAQALIARVQARADTLYDRRIAARLRFLEGEIAEAAQDRDAAAASYRAAVGAWGREVDARLALARLAEQAGDRAAARRLLEAAVDADPARPPARLALAFLLERTGDRPAAIRIAREAAERAPRSPEAHLALGELLARAGEAEGARGEAAELAALGAAPEQALLEGVAALEAGDAAGARAALARAEARALGGSPPARPIAARAALIQGGIEERAGDLAAAQAALERAVAAAGGAPGDETGRAALLALSRIAARAGDFRAAAAAARALLARDVRDGEARSLLFAAEVLGGEGTAAARELAALAASPAAGRAPGAARRLGRLAGAAAWLAAPDVALAETSEAVLEIAEALEALEAATRPGAPPAPALLARGLLLARLGRRGDARAALATAVGLDPGLAAAREALARLRSLPDEPAPAPIEGRFSRAALAGADPVKLLARAEAELARRPRDPAPARALAAANAALGRHERALAEARRAVALGPGDPVSLALLAEITAQGSGTALPLALIEARAAARAAPRAGGVRALEGVLLLRARRAGEAVPALETAAAVWPRDAEVRRVLGEALLAAGDPDRAAAELSAAIALAGPAANDGSARLLATARARSLAGRDEAPPAAAPLAPGDRITVAVEPGGVRVHALEAGRARLLRLAFEAPRSAPSILELVAAPPGGPPAVEKRIEASPGARLAIDGIAPEAGLRARVTVRPGGGPDAYALALAASREDPAEFEVEPDDDLPRAVLLAPGHRRRGIIAPPGDVDCFRLVSPPGAQSGALDVRAPRAASLEVRILRDGPAGLVALEEKAVAAGASAAFAVPMEDGERLFAVISGAAGTAAPVGDDAYALAWRLAPAAGAGEPGREAEPNDRPEWATAVPCGARIAGEIRPAGDVDWLRLAPPPAPGGALALTLAADGGPALSVSIIARRGARFGTLLDTVVRPGAPLAIPRFALPPGAEVLVRLGAAPDGPPAGARWHLSVDAAAPDPAAEVEPDDDWRDALPLELGAARTGELSPAGDRDWYRIDAARPAGPLGIEVTGAAGVRRRLDVYARGPAAGALTPVVSAEVGPGEPLRIDALAAPAGELLVCLSARAQGGPYRIVADREASIREKHGQGRTAGAHQAIGGGVEHRALRLPRGCDVEPNDAGGALAPRLGPGETALGRVTWSGDRDPFVVTLGPAPATLALTAPADAPAALEVYARDATGALTRIGGARAAAGATAAWGPLVAGSEVTVVVTGPRASRSAYRLEVQR